jgi:cell division protein FtsW
MAKSNSALLARPTAPYFLILGSVTILSGLGLVMVLSASSVRALNESGNSFAIAFKQAIYLLFAIFLAWLSMNLRKSLWSVIATYALIPSAIFLSLPHIPGLGKTVGGNTNWIDFGGISLQPSEFAKFGLIIWCAHRLQIHDQKISATGSNNPLPLIAPGFAMIMIFILWGADLGTAAVVAGIFAGILYISGIPTRLFILWSGIGALIFTAFVITSPNRIARFTAFLDPFNDENFMDSGWQQAHSIMGLASGGPFGSGLGSGKQKWGTLPEAHTDFIFSVIGEELGLLGTLTVLLLFVVLIIAIFKTALRADSSFDRYVSAGVGCWLTIQVLLNVGTVLSMLPVVGVTLPFISFGGSSLIATFAGIGYVLGVLKRDPEVKSELSQRRAARGARG